MIPELPVVDAATCTACGDCVAVCPTGCLAMAAALPWLPRPLDCVSCRACELVCAPGSIRLHAACEAAGAG